MTSESDRAAVNKMRIMLANVRLTRRSGTEVVTMELARALARRGHHVCIFASKLSDAALALRREGIGVIDDLLDAPFEPEVVHGNQSVPLVQALVRFRQAAGVYVCHDASFWMSRPPDMARIRAFVAVDRRCRDLVEQTLPRVSGSVRIVHNAVDLAMFSPRARLPTRPRTALILTKQSEHVDLVRAACVRRGLQTDAVGSGVGNEADDLPQRLGRYDIVFATARMAIEALAVGCAVVVCDARGIAGMVTPENVAAWRGENFGQGILAAPVGIDILCREIDRYDPSGALNVSQYIRQRAGLDDAAGEYELIYRQAIASIGPVDAGEENRETSKILGDWLPDVDGIAPAAAGSHRRDHDELVVQYQKLLADHHSLRNSGRVLGRELGLLVMSRMRSAAARLFGRR